MSTRHPDPSNASPLSVLRHHVSGAIARGEGVAIAGKPCPSTTSPFRIALASAIRAHIRESRAEGDTGASLGNLMQCVKAPSMTLEGAPRGTNARFAYHYLFTDVCTARDIAPFILS